MNCECPLAPLVPFGVVTVTVTVPTPCAGANGLDLARRKDFVDADVDRPELHGAGFGEVPAHDDHRGATSVRPRVGFQRGDEGSRVATDGQAFRDRGFPAAAVLGRFPDLDRGAHVGEADDVRFSCGAFDDPAFGDFAAQPLPGALRRGGFPGPFVGGQRFASFRFAGDGRRFHVRRRRGGDLAGGAEVAGAEVPAALMARSWTFRVSPISGALGA